MEKVFANLQRSEKPSNQYRPTVIGQTSYSHASSSTSQHRHFKVHPLLSSHNLRNVVVFLCVAVFFLPVLKFLPGLIYSASRIISFVVLLQHSCLLSLSVGCCSDPLIASATISCTVFFSAVTFFFFFGGPPSLGNILSRFLS